MSRTCVCVCVCVCVMCVSVCVREGEGEREYRGEVDGAADFGLLLSVLAKVEAHELHC